jgi:hypothetical protein
MRDYLDRAWILLVRRFWGTYEWQGFMASMSRVLPGKEPVDIDNKDAIFHVLYDMDDRVQVPGIWDLSGAGERPYWKAIYDEKGRIIAAITPNSDLGDAWEHADNPRYPEKSAKHGDPHRHQLHGLRLNALVSLQHGDATID